MCWVPSRASLSALLSISISSCKGTFEGSTRVLKGLIGSGGLGFIVLPQRPRPI